MAGVGPLDALRAAKTGCWFEEPRFELPALEISSLTGPNSLTKVGTKWASGPLVLSHSRLNP